MDVVSGIVLASVTALVLVAAGVTFGFVALFRRRGNVAITAGSPSGSSAFGFPTATLAELGAKAGSALVTVDDAVRTADHELGFAIAQFGAERSRQYGQSIAAARAKLAEAFRLRQALDDATPDSDQQKREWTLQIIALCDQADGILKGQDAAFAELRSREAGAIDSLDELRSRIAATRTRLNGSRATSEKIVARYSPSASAGVTTSAREAEAALTAASSAADDAAVAIAPSGVNAVSDVLQRASDSVRQAEQLLDAVDRTAADLHAAETALLALRESAHADLGEARGVRDSAPDPESGRAIIEAMADLEKSLVAHPGLADPVAELDRIGDAVAALDLTLASARNQSDRLAHARAAYAGTLVSAASQIAVVRELVATKGGGVSARTRLAEAERQYALAQVETDPVEALDTVRRAVTLARDADALARFTG